MNLTYKLLHVVQWEFSKDTIFFNMPHSKTLKLGKINVLSCDLTKQRQKLFCVLLGSAVVVCLFFFLQQFVISNDMHHNPGNSDILVHRKK